MKRLLISVLVVGLGASVAHANRTLDERAVRAGIFLGGVGQTLRQMQRTSRVERNPWTGKVQRVGLTRVQEHVLGNLLMDQAIAQAGGAHRDGHLQAYVTAVGERVVRENGLHQTGYPFQFTVVNSEIPNALAAPGGRVLISVGLLRRIPSEAALAKVLGHEVGHVVARHGAEKIVTGNVVEGVTRAAQLAYVGLPDQRPLNLATRNLKRAFFGHARETELEADGLGVHFGLGAHYGREGVAHYVGVLAGLDDGRPELDGDHPNIYPRARVSALVGLATPELGRELGVQRYADNVLARLGAPLVLR